MAGLRVRHDCSGEEIWLGRRGERLDQGSRCIRNGYLIASMLRNLQIEPAQILIRLRRSSTSHWPLKGRELALALFVSSCSRRRWPPDCGQAREDEASLLRPDITTGSAYGCLAMGFGGRELARRAERSAPFFTALAGPTGGKVVPVPGGVLIRRPGRISARFDRD